MKTLIVYDLDTGLPIAVGEAIKAEWARVETAEETNIRAENLIAEEISWERSLNFSESGRGDENEVCSIGYFGGASFILDSACQRAYEGSSQVAPHVPRGSGRD